MASIKLLILSPLRIFELRLLQDKEPIGIIPLENLAVRRIEGKKKFAFEIYHPEQNEDLKACKFDSSGAVVQGHHDTYLIACSNEDDMQNWMKSIEGSVFQNPFLELIRKKLAKQRATKAPKSDNTLKKTFAAEMKINFKELHELAQVTLNKIKNWIPRSLKIERRSIFNDLGIQLFIWSFVLPMICSHSFCRCAVWSLNLKM